MNNNEEIIEELRPIEPVFVNLLEDETRRTILNLLSSSELTVSQISETLQMTPQNIYQQVKKLLEADLVKVTKEERHGHLLEKHYRAVAENFYYGDLIQEQREQENPHIEILRELKGRGHDLEVNEKVAEKLSEILSSRGSVGRASTHDMCVSCGSSKVFLKLGPANALMNDTMLRLENLLLMTDEEFEEYIDFSSRLRRFLISIIKTNGNEKRGG
jgi:DNA-binding transcriptional ArsR family regulator